MFPAFSMHGLIPGYCFRNTGVDSHEHCKMLIMSRILLCYLPIKQRKNNPKMEGWTHRGSNKCFNMFH